MKSWGWTVQYGSALLLALLLGVILGNIPLFKETALGSTKLTAAHVVQFLGYGGALVMFWLMGQRAAVQLPREGSSPSFLGQIIPPFATLVVLAAGYQVALLLLGPLLGKTGKGIYNWIFVVGIVGAALWLTAAWFRNASSLSSAFETVKEGRSGRSGSGASGCPRCGESVRGGQKFCAACGQKLTVEPTKPKAV